jgi:hypothetical protein
MQTYLVQLRGEDEDDGDDRLALAGRHYFLSSAPSSTFFFFLLSFCVGSLCSVSSARLLPALSLFFFVFVCSEGDYDGKGPGAAGWLDPSFLWFCFSSPFFCGLLRLL